VVTTIYETRMGDIDQGEPLCNWTSKGLFLVFLAKYSGTPHTRCTKALAPSWYGGGFCTGWGVYSLWKVENRQRNSGITRATHCTVQDSMIRVPTILLSQQFALQEILLHPLSCTLFHPAHHRRPKQSQKDRYPSR